MAAVATAVRPEARLLRWFGSYGTFAVPQAAAPIAFSLIALPLTGSASSGAAMMLAMTIAQVPIKSIIKGTKTAAPKSKT